MGSSLKIKVRRKKLNSNSSKDCFGVGRSGDGISRCIIINEPIVLARPNQTSQFSKWLQSKTI